MINLYTWIDRTNNDLYVKVRLPNGKIVGMKTKIYTTREEAFHRVIQQIGESLETRGDSDD